MSVSWVLRGEGEECGGVHTAFSWRTCLIAVLGTAVLSERHGEQGECCKNNGKHFGKKFLERVLTKWRDGSNGVKEIGRFPTYISTKEEKRLM